eukprot:scaffold97321_cov32-Tisochrysis_lutea.AAC.2
MPRTTEQERPAALRADRAHSYSQRVRRQLRPDVALTLDEGRGRAVGRTLRVTFGSSFACGPDEGETPFLRDCSLSSPLDLSKAFGRFLPDRSSLSLFGVSPLGRLP